MLTTASTVSLQSFGRTSEGCAVTCFTLYGVGGAVLEVLDYGAVIRALHVPDRDGEMADVVLGYDDLRDYERDPFYLGAVIGRYAGRISGARFSLDGIEHRLTANDGANHLHGGHRGFHRAVWDAWAVEEDDAPSVILQHTSPAGDEGYPGTLRVTVTYTLTPENTLVFEYRARADAATPVSLTQHPYFNLAGEGAGDVLGHHLDLPASRYLPLAPSFAPAGEVAPVAGTPLDFRVARPIGASIAAEHPQLARAGGHDHYYVLDRRGFGLARAAGLYEPRSGRTLEVLTTEPGVQLYTGNFLDGSLAGKRCHRYGRNAGVCLETEGFPDAPNHAAFPCTILRPGEELRSRTEYRFGVREGDEA